MVKKPLVGNLHHEAEVLASGFPPLLVSAERVAATVSQGVHGRRRVGQGETFWQFRRYEFGDSTGLIDWRQSAKSQHIFVRETEWEAAQTIWLWRDGSKSMKFRSAKSTLLKSQRSDLLMLAVASLFIRGGEKVALMGTGMKPSASRRTLTRICSMIEGDTVPDDNLPRKEFLPRHSHTIWFGDFLAPLNNIKEIVGHYAGLGVSGYILQILDPAEETLPYDGRVLFGGMESGESDLLVRNTGSLRPKYKKELAQQKEGLVEITKSYGWKFSSHVIHEPAGPALRDLFLYFSKLSGR